jgi:tetratricopeptide (TPR) repeat protein
MRAGGAARSLALDNLYVVAKELVEHGKTELAWKLIDKLLIENPNDVQALTLASYVMHKLGGLTQAYHFAKAATVLMPTNAAAWTNFGHAASKLWLIDEAESYYKRALGLSKTEHDFLVLWLNLSALCLDNGQFDKALHYVRKVLAVDPEHKSALTNLGFCQLALRNWEGWKGYHGTIGSDWRKKVVYKDEPEWDGTPGKVVALYADQGLGDEISFSSMVPDAAQICRKLILDCDGRLAGLFTRSFPNVKVYGTRIKDTKWAKEDRNIEASLPLGQIGEFFRTTDESFPGTPYLVPCPQRVKQWKALFEPMGKPVIGIAWTGGVPKSNARNRRITLNELAPVLKLDAHFVSLQYQDAAKDIEQLTLNAPRGTYDLVQYPWATLTDDYDDTAALIAACDYVLCIQTAVAHTAAGIGVPVTVLLPTATTWRYGVQHDTIPWYRSLNIIRQSKTGSWSDEVERAVTRLTDHFPGLSTRAGAATPIGDVRTGVHPVRPHGEPDHRANGSRPPA